MVHLCYKKRCFWEKFLSRCLRSRGYGGDNASKKIRRQEEANAEEDEDASRGFLGEDFYFLACFTVGASKIW